MSIWKQQSTSDDIVNGIATICPVGTVANYKYDPGSGNRGYSQHIPSGESLRMYQTLDSRYKLRPSGWSH